MPIPGHVTGHNCRGHSIVKVKPETLEWPIVCFSPSLPKIIDLTNPFLNVKHGIRECGLPNPVVSP